MKSQVFVLLTAALHFVAYAQDLSTEIKAATVYRSEAYVERSVRTEIQKGTATLNFTGLPQGIDLESIKVKSSPEFQVLDIRPEQRSLEHDSIKLRSMKLEADYKNAVRTQKKIRSEWDILKREESVLLNNTSFKEEKSRLQITTFNAKKVKTAQLGPYNARLFDNDLLERADYLGEKDGKYVFKIKDSEDGYYVKKLAYVNKETWEIEDSNKLNFYYWAHAKYQGDSYPSIRYTLFDKDGDTEELFDDKYFIYKQELLSGEYRKIGEKKINTEFTEKDDNEFYSEWPKVLFVQKRYNQIGSKKLKIDWNNIGFEKTVDVLYDYCVVDAESEELEMTGSFSPVAPAKEKGWVFDLLEWKITDRGDVIFIGEYTNDKKKRKSKKSIVNRKIIYGVQQKGENQSKIYNLNLDYPAMGYWRLYFSGNNKVIRAIVPYGKDEERQYQGLLFVDFDLKTQEFVKKELVFTDDELQAFTGDLTEKQEYKESNDFTYSRPNLQRRYPMEDGSDLYVMFEKSIYYTQKVDDDGRKVGFPKKNEIRGNIYVLSMRGFEKQWSHIIPVYSDVTTSTGVINFIHGDSLHLVYSDRKGNFERMIEGKKMYQHFSGDMEMVECRIDIKNGEAVYDLMKLKGTPMKKYWPDTESAVIVNKDPITIYAPWYGTLGKVRACVLTRQKVEED